ncbi:MAG: SHOCT domain-containing protein [bacterium]
MWKRIVIYNLSVLLLSGCASEISILSKEYNQPTIAQEIIELKKLVDAGTITKEEYEKKKNELLALDKDREEKIETKEKPIK